MTTSVDNVYSRYVHGGMSEFANNRIEWWERKAFTSDTSDVQYVVENKFENRLDLISNAAYGEWRYWWIIAQYNNILDPTSEITPGRILILPTKERIEKEFLTGKTGGYPSERTEEKILPPVVV